MEPQPNIDKNGFNNEREVSCIFQVGSIPEAQRAIYKNNLFTSTTRIFFFKEALSLNLKPKEIFMSDIRLEQ